MQRETWKEYESNPLTHSAAHYLMTIRTLLQERGYARVTDIARALNITRGSCSISLKPLKKRGLVTEDENKFLQLSPEGERLAQLVEKNDEVLESFLRDVLGVDGEQAEIDACKIEHLLSLDTSLKLAGFLHYIQSGSKTIKEFLREFGQFNTECAGDATKCNVCDSTCLAEAASAPTTIIRPASRGVSR
ncbi:MAG: metal-dependent transcriptional regulator [Lentisphaerae bacterium]|nr:metal-dependent transcriptional regulator [Lentisphaerota bacterium]